MPNATAKRWRYPYVPQPKQELAHRSNAKEILYGGAAGGGKTDWLLGVAMRGIFHYQVPVLILRRTLGHLQQSEGILDRLRTRLPKTIARYNGQQHTWTFRHGPVLKLGYLRHDGDVEQYMGAQFGIILWDQVEQFTEWQYRRMLHPLRVDEDHPAWKLPGFRPFMGASANPGGVGHTWVKSRWIDPAPPGVTWQPAPTKDEPKPGSRTFIPAKLEDNRYLGADYEAQLEGLPPDEREALRWGNWDVFAGARFSHWRRAVHVVDPEDWPIPEGAGILRGLGVDYGSVNPWAALWGALLADGLIVIYRELYDVGLTPTEQAKAIRAAEGSERGPGRPLPTFLDPSCWARNAEEPTAQVIGGKTIVGGSTPAPMGSIAWRYQQAGVPVMKANNDRRSGTQRLAEKLRVVPSDNMPRLLVYSTCINLIRTLPGMIRDKHNPELYDTHGEDHAVDAARYLVMGLDPGAATSPTSQAGEHPGGPGIGSAGRTETGDLAERGF